MCPPITEDALDSCFISSNLTIMIHLSNLTAYKTTQHTPQEKSSDIAKQVPVMGHRAYSADKAHCEDTPDPPQAASLPSVKETFFKIEIILQILLCAMRRKSCVRECVNDSLVIMKGCGIFGPNIVQRTTGQ